MEQVGGGGSDSGQQTSRRYLTVAQSRADILFGALSSCLYRRPHSCPQHHTSILQTEPLLEPPLLTLLLIPSSYSPHFVCVAVQETQTGSFMG